MSSSIFIVGSLLLAAVAFSHGSPAQTLSDSNLASQQGPDAVSPAEQCRQRNGGMYYTNACQIFIPETICEGLLCSSGRGDISFGENTGPALDGTWCGPRKACQDGQCTGISQFEEDPFVADIPEYCEFGY